MTGKRILAWLAYAEQDQPLELELDLASLKQNTAQIVTFFKNKVEKWMLRLFHQDGPPILNGVTH